MADIASWSRVACAALLVASVTAGCDSEAQYAPSLPAVAGFRVDDGVLRLWTGTPCSGVIGATLIFDTGTEKSAKQQWSAPKPGVSLERMNLLDTSPDGGGPLQVEKALPADYDWTKATSIVFYVDGPKANGVRVDVDQVLSESAKHPSESYLFGEAGWLDAADVRRGNGKSFLTMCTPDPK
jgi:hypothetical protein